MFACAVDIVYTTDMSDMRHDVLLRQFRKMLLQ